MDDQPGVSHGVRRTRLGFYCGQRAGTKSPMTFGTRLHRGMWIILAVAAAAMAAPPDDDASTRTLTGHTGSVMSVAFSPDGKVLASSSRDKSVRLWNPSTGEVLRTLAGHTADVYSVV